MSKSRKKGLFVQAIQDWLGDPKDPNYLKVREAAGKIGIAPSHLSDILQGKKTRLKPELVKKIADALGKSHEEMWLLQEIDDELNPPTVRQKLTHIYQRIRDDISASVDTLFEQEWSRENREDEREQMKNELRQIWRLRRTPDIWLLYKSLIKGFIEVQDEYIAALSSSGQNEGLTRPRNLRNVFSELADQKGRFIQALDGKRERNGYLVSAIHLPSQYATYEPGTLEPGAVSAYGYEIGYIITGKGVFYSRGSKEKKYRKLRIAEHNLFSFSRHRSHSLYAETDMEILHIQLPFTERAHRRPDFFLVSERGIPAKIPKTLVELMLSDKRRYSNNS